MRFASLVGAGRVAGAQFHPERSSAAGDAMLRGFLALGRCCVGAIIPCLDVSGGRVVKGVNFVNLRDCGEPVAAAVRYAEQGADEICWLNITAGDEAWDALLAQVEQAAEQVDVPVTVGGGVSAERAGARAARAPARTRSPSTRPRCATPALVDECAARHGSQCIVVAIDAKAEDGSLAGLRVGRPPADRRTTRSTWAEEAVSAARASCW